jgi:hypothetical protein
MSGKDDRFGGGDRSGWVNFEGIVRAQSCEGELGFGIKEIELQSEKWRNGIRGCSWSGRHGQVSPGIEHLSDCVLYCTFGLRE